MSDGQVAMLLDSKEKQIDPKTEIDLAKTSEIVVDEEQDEEMEDARDAMIEEAVKERVDLWLDTHGAKLFALEYSKAAVKEGKRSFRAGLSVPARPAQKEEESKITSGDSTKRRRMG